MSLRPVISENLNTGADRILLVTVTIYKPMVFNQGSAEPCGSASTVQGSARSYTNFILLIKLNAVFSIRQLNYCTGVPRVTKMFFGVSLQ